MTFFNQLSSPQCQIRFGGRKEIASDSDSRCIKILPIYLEI